MLAAALPARADDAHACPPLDAAVNTAPQLDALFALADCDERAGKLASAWRTLHTALDQAKQGGDAQHEQLASDRIAAIEPRLIKLRIDAVPLPQLVVQRDGADVTATLGVDQPIDPGAYTIVASAPGHLPWMTTIAATAEGTVVPVSVPPLGVQQAASTQVDVVALRGRFRPFVTVGSGICGAGDLSRTAGYPAMPCGVAAVGVRRGLGRELELQLAGSLIYSQLTGSVDLMDQQRLEGLHLFAPSLELSATVRPSHWYVTLGGQLVFLAVSENVLDAASGTKFSQSSFAVQPAFVAETGWAFGARDQWRLALLHISLGSADVITPTAVGSSTLLMLHVELGYAF